MTGAQCALRIMAGDLARWLPDGNIEFLGRIDSQVGPSTCFAVVWALHCVSIFLVPVILGYLSHSADAACCLGQISGSASATSALLISRSNACSTLRPRGLKLLAPLPWSLAYVPAVLIRMHCRHCHTIQRDESFACICLSET